MKKLEHLTRFKGKDHMIFKAPRCDADIQKVMAEEHKMLDISPAEPPNLAWKMRPREKGKELGPEFRFKYRT